MFDTYICKICFRLIDINPHGKGRPIVFLTGHGYRFHKINHHELESWDSCMTLFEL